MLKMFMKTDDDGDDDDDDDDDDGDDGDDDSWDDDDSDDGDDDSDVEDDDGHGEDDGDEMMITDDYDVDVEDKEEGGRPIPRPGSTLCAGLPNRHAHAHFTRAICMDIYRERRPDAATVEMCELGRTRVIPPRLNTRP